jgi:hypothetical protein
MKEYYAVTAKRAQEVFFMACLQLLSGASPFTLPLRESPKIKASFAADFWVRGATSEVETPPTKISLKNQQNLLLPRKGGAMKAIYWVVTLVCLSRAGGNRRKA